MLFDSNLIFFGTSPYASVSNYVSLAGLTASSTSSTINITTPAELGIGDGEAVPKIAAYVGTAFTSASASLALNFQFQGSTDSTNWTTYIESGALATSVLVANAKVMAWDLPHRSPGAAFPQYYRLRVASSGNTNESVSSGSIFAGIVIQRNDNPGGNYSSGFTVI